MGNHGLSTELHIEAPQGSFARLNVRVSGAVQGVGFRPFVYRLAGELGLHGWAGNTPDGLSLELEGPAVQLKAFVRRLRQEKPAAAHILHIESSWLPPIGLIGFEIRESATSARKTAVILPDLATCPSCMAEVFDPRNRRYLYPFTNCTQCGPRFSIIEGLPYDRPRTSMRRFTMCPACQEEYETPGDRRFHAQPNACPQCGPHLELWDATGAREAKEDRALRRAAELIREGNIVAVKGLGGFHLMVDAGNVGAVRRLRRRKGREEKPFALMFPDLASAEAYCHVSDQEARLLGSAASPIVLLARRPRTVDRLAEVAPHNPYFGVMLPYTPLHRLLMDAVGMPVVATSGNLSEEPICIDEREAIGRLGKIADSFLVHNRPIVRHVDDSIVRLVAGREQILRRARGYAPLPFRIVTHGKQRPEYNPILAVGAHLKNTVALSVGNNVFISQHIGDLENVPAFAAFEKVIGAFESMYETTPSRIACDLHPDYLSTHYAADRDIPVLPVQHHYAHVLACMAENELEAPVLGVSWDGTGYGPDGTIWGGEFLRISDSGFTRFACLHPFLLPGGDRAVREPRRAALGLLYTAYGEDVFNRIDLDILSAFTDEERSLLRRMLDRRINTPSTSSAGRLFDAVAALVGLRHRSSYEGQAAMELEFSMSPGKKPAPYRFELVERGSLTDGITKDRRGAHRTDETAGSRVAMHSPEHFVDWRPMIAEILEDAASGEAPGHIAARFHVTLVHMICYVAEQAGEANVVLTGGCFQNRYLTEVSIRNLRERGHRPYWHRHIPPNDGGISLGQVMAALRDSADGLVERKSDT